MSRGKKAGAFFIIAGIIAIIILGTLLYIKTKYTVKTVYVEGNVHYSEEDVKAIVMDGPFGFGENSLYLSLKYRNKGIKNVPFVDVMDVNVLAPDTIKISVYEKMLTGYVKYLDSYMYFDKDGYVVESSAIRTEGVPQITGLKFESVVLEELLPVENQEIFNKILNITKLLNKYSLTAGRIHFNQNGEVFVYFGDVKVALGDEDARLEDKMMILPELLVRLEGMSGTLQMQTYDEGNGQYVFKPE